MAGGQALTFSGWNGEGAWRGRCCMCIDFSHVGCGGKCASPLVHINVGCSVAWQSQGPEMGSSGRLAGQWQVPYGPVATAEIALQVAGEEQFPYLGKSAQERNCQSFCWPVMGPLQWKHMIAPSTGMTCAHIHPFACPPSRYPPAQFGERIKDLKHTFPTPTHIPPTLPTHYYQLRILGVHIEDLKPAHYTHPYTNHYTTCAFWGYTWKTSNPPITTTYIHPLYPPYPPAHSWGAR
eukprot:1141749-Pelagomonas_calceolata.AAC.8